MIVVPDNLRAAVSSASADGFPIVAATVDPDGQPELAFYGSTQPLGEGGLALWARRPENLLKRMETNPRISFIYFNRTTHVAAKFFGTASVISDEAGRTAVFEGSPEGEQALDPERKGTAIAVALHRVTGFSNGEPFTIE